MVSLDDFVKAANVQHIPFDIWQVKPPANKTNTMLIVVPTRLQVVHNTCSTTPLRCLAAHTAKTELQQPMLERKAEFQCLFVSEQRYEVL